MRYPTTLQYAESLTNPDGLFRSLQPVEVRKGGDGEPIYRSGNFGTVFKINCSKGLKALKCFTRPQAGRLAAYQQIAGNIGRHLSPYIVNYSFIPEELYAFDSDDTGRYYPALLMDWVEGATLTDEIKHAALSGNRDKLKSLSVKFDRLSLWLLEQPFAHGDLKPDNIMVRCDGSLVLIDYDGIFLPQMAGEAARENGTPFFQHPKRNEYFFNKHIDDYPIVLISIILDALAEDPELWAKYNDGEGLQLYPVQIFEGSSPCYEEIATTSIGKTRLFDSLLSESPAIEGIHGILNDKAFGKPAKVSILFSALPENRVEQYELPLPEPANKYLPSNQSRKFAATSSFEKILGYSEGLAAVKIKDKWGFADEAGKIVIPAIYEYAGSYSEGVAVVSLAGKYGYIDKTGRMICRMKFDDAWSFSHSLGMVRKGRKYGFIGADGLMAISARFDFAHSFSEGKACVMSEGKFGYIDLRGRWVVKPAYSYATSVRNGNAYAELGDRVIRLSFDDDGKK